MYGVENKFGVVLFYVSLQGDYESNTITLHIWLYTDLLVTISAKVLSTLVYVRIKTSTVHLTHNIRIVSHIDVCVVFASSVLH